MATYSTMSTSFNPLSVIVTLLSISSLVLCRHHHTSVSVDVGGGESHDPEHLQTYIVRVQPPAGVVDAGPTELESWYKSFLSESSSNMNESRLLHSYSEVFIGFSAKLTQAELKSMQKREEFVHAFPNQELRLLTTHTPAFLDLHMGRGLWNASALGRGVIIGLLDSGITPTHPSFSDDGVPPPPARWKGACDFEDGGCNNKLIGARTIVRNTGPPFDILGHGTHTAGTAAGNFVQGASAYGQANGTAAGIAPHAHVAMYMVCIAYICSGDDILAGFDAAVKDGVDVISVSLGTFGGVSPPFYMDSIAIGAFGAAEKGIIVSCGAGNDGPSRHSLSNEAPWYITVGATSVDRSFRASVRLSNGRVYEGESLNQFNNFSSKPFALAYSSNFSNCTGFPGFNITGKIVVCDPGISAVSSDIAEAVNNANGVGMLIVNAREDGYSVAVKDFVLPASQLSAADGAAVVAYASKAENKPTASIVFNGTILGTSPSPVVASFSSRGPNIQSLSILKPDVSAPGLNILAAWPSSVIGQESDAEKIFSIASGTSMATPHVSGIAALIKSVHPNWSPAAVKSAIITTSDAEGQSGEPILDELHQKASFFAMGAGQVNPSKAVDPGLVYDVSVDDYIGYICKIYGDKGAHVIVRSSNVSCSKVEQKSAEELNLPSIVAPLGSKPWTTTRVVTNVGEAKSTYTARLDIPNEVVTIQVTPPTLRFTALGEKKTFDVTVKWSGRPLSGTVEGNLRWISDAHVVRSPIVVVSSLPV